jgi:hypothetical protein
MRLITGCHRATSVDHLLAESKMMCVSENLSMLCSRFLISCLSPSHRPSRPLQKQTESSVEGDACLQIPKHCVPLLERRYHPKKGLKKLLILLLFVPQLLRRMSTLYLVLSLLTSILQNKLYLVSSVPPCPAFVQGSAQTFNLISIL